MLVGVNCCINVTGDLLGKAGSVGAECFIDGKGCLVEGAVGKISTMAGL